MQAQQSRLQAQRRKKVRDEILSDMERTYQRILEEKDELRRRMEEVQEAGRANGQEISWINERLQRLESRMDKLEKETTSAIRRAEGKLEESMGQLDSRMESASKTMQNMTHAVIGGFCAITLAVMVLFITLIIRM